MRKSQMFGALVEYTNKHQIGPLWYHWKGHEILKMPFHCSFKFKMHELWSKERLKFPLKQRLNDIQLGCAIHHWNLFFKGYKILPLHAPKRLVWKKYGHPKFQNNKSPNFGCHLSVVPTKSHKIYYKEVLPPKGGKPCKTYVSSCPY